MMIIMPYCEPEKFAVGFFCNSELHPFDTVKTVVKVTNLVDTTAFGYTTIA